jgi:hypothetical protein
LIGVATNIQAYLAIGKRMEETGCEILLVSPPFNWEISSGMMGRRLF